MKKYKSKVEPNKTKSTIKNIGKELEIGIKFKTKPTIDKVIRKRNEMFPKFIDFYRRTFKCQNDDLEMSFQHSKVGEKEFKLLVQGYSICVDINNKTICESTPICYCTRYF